MAAVSPLSMSQTKDDLLKHLGIPPEIYTLMAKETDRVYKWLTKDPKHLKSNCKRNPPYDWSDILEKEKDHAMQRISEGGDMYTSYYWHLATPTSDCPNWIAKWFLYHKFRYRDGRNRGNAKDRGDELNHPHSSQHSRQYSRSKVESYTAQDHDHHADKSRFAEGSVQVPSHPIDVNSKSNTHYGYDVAPTYNITAEQSIDTPKPRAFDPVRDI